jgi:hypothetical protein
MGKHDTLCVLFYFCLNRFNNFLTNKSTNKDFWFLLMASLAFFLIHFIVFEMTVVMF